MLAAEYYTLNLSEMTNRDSEVILLLEKERKLFTEKCVTTVRLNVNKSRDLGIQCWRTTWPESPYTNYSQ